jgi:dienelactone hydrolase
MKTKRLVCIALTSVCATGCPDIDLDANEGVSASVAEFDPANRIIPFPNNLLIDPATGKVNLPPGCSPTGGPESPTAQALRENVLNQLDGFGTFKTTLNVTFTEPVDVASLPGNVFLFKVTADPADSPPIPLIFVPNQTVRFDASCANPQPVEQVTFIPAADLDGDGIGDIPVPLDDKSTYVVGVTEGVTSVTGSRFVPAPAWFLVRAVQDPVTIDEAGVIVEDRTPLDPAIPEEEAQLRAIDQLWNAHQLPIQFLAAKGVPQDALLFAWSFNTQTITDPLDPAVAGSPAAVAVRTPPLVGVTPLAPSGEAFLNAALPGQCQNQGGPLPCQNVGEVLGAGLLAKQYQIDTPNPLDPATPIPGPWADPISPPVVHDPALGPDAPGGGAPIPVLITTPAAAICASRCPTVVYGHGLGTSKSSLVAIASQLATAGFNTVAIDFVAHGDRAVRISNDPALGCGGTPAPGEAPQCFAPLLSPNLATMRDSIRQSVVDTQALVAALEACGPDACGPLSVDPAGIVHLGVSLGGIIGSVTAAVTPDFGAAVLYAPGVGWVDIVEGTGSLAIRCALVDALIRGGILVGEPFDPSGPSGLCLGEDWKLQPGYRQFAVIARWVLDPADPANFTRELASQTILLQEVVGDQVIPNATTDLEAALVRLPPMLADPARSATPPPSDAITTRSAFLKYLTLPPSNGFPGNTFDHGSFLRPTPGSGLAGRLGTVRLQTDAITFLVLNNR